MPKVSVIIPVYNVEKYLEKCIESVINQTLKDIEIICVNDGSTDNSLDILTKYSKNEPRMTIITQVNSGLSEARNTGIRIATGEYIGLLDSDDYVDLDFYEKLYKSAIKYNADIACGDIIRFSSKKHKILLNLKDEAIVETVKEKFQITGVPAHNYVWNKIYKREALIKSEIEFIKGRTYEDMPYTVDVLEKLGKLVTVPNVYYNYRSNPNSIIKTPTDKNRDDSIKSKSYLAEKCREYNMPESKDLDLISKDEYFFLGIKVLKVYRYHATTVYSIFGILPILTKKSR